MEILSPSKSGLQQACKILRQGDLVAFPTETVYGLGADARNDNAVAKIFDAKQRPTFNPLIVHVANIENAKTIAEFNPLADRLAAAFWPGPLTLVLPLKAQTGISDLVTAGLNTIAIRVPEQDTANRLLAMFDGPVAAPSANPSGKVSPTRVEHVVSGLQGRIAAVVDDGPCSVGVESTIIGLSGTPTLLRAGGLPVEVIEDCIGQSLGAPTTQSQPTAPGQLASHYATNATIRMNAKTRATDEILLGFGPVECVFNLSRSGDLVEAAANLFHFLRELDATSQGKIAVSPIPDHGLGRAINDRLRRAAAPRD